MHIKPLHKQVILVNIDRPDVIFPEMGYVYTNFHKTQNWTEYSTNHILNHYETGGKNSIFKRIKL